MSSTPATPSAIDPTVTAPAPQSPAPVPAPEPTVTAPAKQSALVRFGLPILGIVLVLLVFINTIQNTSINGNVVKVNNNIVALDTNLSETTKIAKDGNKTATEALKLAKETAAAVEGLTKAVDSSKTAMVAEGDKNRGTVSQLADHVVTLVTAVKAGDAKTQGDVAELQKSLAASTKQSSEASAAQVTQAAQITSKLDEIKAQLANTAAAAAPQASGVNPNLVAVDPTRTPTQVSATPKGDILSGTQGGSSGEASSTKTEWKRYVVSANVDSQEFSARKARNGDIRLELKGRVTLIQRFSGWSNRRRESVSAVSQNGYTVLLDADTVAFRSDEKFVVWEKEN